MTEQPYRETWPLRGRSVARVRSNELPRYYRFRTRRTPSSATTRAAIGLIPLEDIRSITWIDRYPHPSGSRAGSALTSLPLVWGGNCHDAFSAAAADQEWDVDRGSGCDPVPNTLVVV